MEDTTTTKIRHYVKRNGYGVDVTTRTETTPPLTIRARVYVDHYDFQSYAVAEVMNADRTWTNVQSASTRGLPSHYTPDVLARRDAGAELAWSLIDDARWALGVPDVLAEMDDAEVAADIDDGTVHKVAEINGVGTLYEIFARDADSFDVAVSSGPVRRAFVMNVAWVDAMDVVRDAVAREIRLNS